MRKIFVFAALCTVMSCSRHTLNYQSNQQPAPYNDQNNYTQAPQPAPPTPAPTQNYNQQPDNNYTTDNNGNYNNNNVNYSAPSYQTFYDELGPYGNWVNYPNYGYVWVPNTGPGFSPYCTNGQWVYTDYGWTWSSNYSWGWAPFHYGRWMEDPMYGWMWVPGTEWGPAWVTWGQTYGYYGWAPLGPGVNPYDNYRPAAQYWTYAPQDRMMQPNVSSYVINSYSPNYETTVNYNTVVIINNRNTYNQTTYNSGPQAIEVERVTGHSITPVRVNNASKPTPNNSANEINIYRPAINPATNTTSTPVKVVPVTNLKPVNTHQAPPSNNPRTLPGNQNNPQGPRPVQPVPVRPNTQPTSPNQNERPLPPVTPTPKPVQTEPVKPTTQPVTPPQNQRPNPTPVREQPTPAPAPRPVQTEPVKPTTQPVTPPQNERPNPTPVREQPAPMPRPVQSEPVKPTAQPVPPVQNERPLPPVREQPAPAPRPVQTAPVQNNRPPVQPQPKPQPKPQPRPQPKPQPEKK